jgi:hypothetical protein
MCWIADRKLVRVEKPERHTPKHREDLITFYESFYGSVRPKYSTISAAQNHSRPVSVKERRSDGGWGAFEGC